jgi:hypothetical protein
MNIIRRWMSRFVELSGFAAVWKTCCLHGGVGSRVGGLHSWLLLLSSLCKIRINGVRVSRLTIRDQRVNPRADPIYRDSRARSTTDRFEAIAQTYLWGSHSVSIGAVIVLCADAKNKSWTYCSRLRLLRVSQAITEAVAISTINIGRSYSGIALFAE